jgi:ion channel
VLETTAAHALVILGTLTALAACVLLQYEGLLLVWRRLAAQTGHRRVKVLYSILTVILLHVLEIWIFGAMIWLLLLWPACGSISGPQTTGLVECMYFSAVTFTTLGFGDVLPVGPLRFMAAAESLIGLVLIAWSASFAYIEMEKFWRADDLDAGK